MPFKTAFFGYSELPSIVNYNNQVLIPLKQIRINHQGTEQKSPFDLYNLRKLCKVIGIPVYRPTPGLYCVRECDEFFFYKLSSLFNEKRISFYGNHYEYDNCGNLYDWLMKKILLKGNQIKNLYEEYLLNLEMGLSTEEFKQFRYLYRKANNYKKSITIC